MIDDQAPETEPDTPSPITDHRQPTNINPLRRPSSTGPVNGHLSRWLIPPLAEPVEDEDVVGGSAGPLSGPNTGKLTFDGVSEPYRVG